MARHFGFQAGLIAADFALYQGIRREVLARLVEEMPNYPGIEIARKVVECADREAESPLETLGRLAFISAGRNPPQSNVCFQVASRMYRVDHFLPDTGVVIEADGAVKYNNRPDADQIVRDEKERELDLRSLGHQVVRYNFGLVTRRPHELLRRVDSAGRLRRSAPLRLV